MCSKVKDFLTDDDFINYALGVTPEAASQWETYFREHPEQIADAEEAKGRITGSGRCCLRLFTG